MKPNFKLLVVATAMLVTTIANADENGRLFIIGNSTPYEWDLDMAQALLSTTGNPTVYTGTIYLKGGEEYTFKFMEAHEWGSTEYGVPASVESTVVNGNFQLSSGTLDDGYQKMFVTENSNYDITIDIKNLDANITLSEYQETEINYCSLFLVGNATPGDWSVENGTALYQSVNTPYEYSTTVNLKANGSFKIATALRGAGGWNAKYFYFKDADDAGKISTDDTDDRQWSVEEDGDYTVSVNTLANTITIDKQNNPASGIEKITNSSTEYAHPVYYNLQGCRVDNPSNGVFIEVIGNNAKKVIFN